MTIWPVLAIMSGTGFMLFVAITTAADGMVRYALAIFAFGSIYGFSPLTKTWISQILSGSHPAEKRAVAIALINALGNGSSIHGSWPWPDQDSPRFLVGFGQVQSLR